MERLTRGGACSVEGGQMIGRRPRVSVWPGSVWRLAFALCSVAAAPLWLPAVASAESCPNAAFRTAPPRRCRTAAYEMVTAFKDGATIGYGSSIGAQSGGVSPTGESVPPIRVAPLPHEGAAV
jgi:hypothetical protein